MKSFEQCVVDIREEKEKADSLALYEFEKKIKSQVVKKMVIPSHLFRKGLIK